MNGYRYIVLAIAVSLFFSMLSLGMVASVEGTKEDVNAGFDEYGYNFNARLFNGWLGYHDREIEEGWLAGTMDSWLNSKWSRDWNLSNMEETPVGAWCTMHFTWYSNDYSEDTAYGWVTREKWEDKTETPETEYKINEFVKIKKISDNREKWLEYSSNGARPAEYLASFGDQDEAPDWLTTRYDSNVPKYIIFQDTIEVIDVNTGEIVLELNRVEVTPRGLG